MIATNMGSKQKLEGKKPPPVPDELEFQSSHAKAIAPFFPNEDATLVKSLVR